MKETISKIVEALMVLGLVWIMMSTAGCHTVSGIGQDLEGMADHYIFEE